MQTQINELVNSVDTVCKSIELLIERDAYALDDLNTQIEMCKWEIQKNINHLRSLRAILGV